LRPAIRRLGWFVAIYLLSLIAFATAAYALRYLIMRG
jgi:hypothetical protein